MVRLIRRGASAEKVTRAAEEVRAARVRVLRSKGAQVVPSGDAALKRLRRLEDEIRAVEATPIADIVLEFTQSGGSE